MDSNWIFAQADDGPDVAPPPGGSGWIFDQAPRATPYQVAAPRPGSLYMTFKLGRPVDQENYAARAAFRSRLPATYRGLRGVTMQNQIAQRLNPEGIVVRNGFRGTRVIPT